MLDVWYICLLTRKRKKAVGKLQMIGIIECIIEIRHGSISKSRFLYAFELDKLSVHNLDS
jgi:hypothetical protein